MDRFEFSIKTKKDPPPPRDNSHVVLTRLARSTGYSLSHISRIFSCETKPSMTCLVRLSTELGISIDEFVRKLDTGEMRISQCPSGAALDSIARSLGVE
jgi:transcriptional regulator with XRE-family HTH domain